MIRPHEDFAPARRRAAFGKRAGFWLSSALLLVGGCYEDIQLLGESRHAAARPASMADAGAKPPSAPDADSCGEASFAHAHPATGLDTCVDPVARIFRYALCTCDDAVFNAPFETDAFDSAQGSGGPVLGGASVGANGRFVAAAAVELAGSWIASGAASSSLQHGRFHIAGNLKTQGGLTLNDSQVSLDRDLWIRGQLVAVNATLHAKGVRFQSPPVTSVGDVIADGGTQTRPFSIAPPCACGDRAPLDFDALASQFASNHDNAALGASADALRSADEASRELPCGRYRLGAGRLSGARWRVSGRVALFVDGDLELADRFEPEFSSGGALEIFVRGSLTLAPGVSVGSRDHAGALRFFVGGQSTLMLTGGSQFAASLYAPLNRPSTARCSSSATTPKSTARSTSIAP